LFSELNTCGYSPYVTSSLSRGCVCRLQLLLTLASAVNLRSIFRGTHDHVLLTQIRDSPNLEGQVPVFISPTNTVAQLYPRALCSALHSNSNELLCLFITLRHGPCRKHSLSVFEKACLEHSLHSNRSYSIVACVFVATRVCLPSSCLVMDVSSSFTIPAFGRHDTIYCVSRLESILKFLHGNYDLRYTINAINTVQKSC
jgi:hypothetical protein